MTAATDVRQLADRLLRLQVVHNADAQPVEVDVRVALNAAAVKWRHEGITAAVTQLRLEDGFLSAVHGDDYHLLPGAQKVLGRCAS